MNKSNRIMEVFMLGFVVAIVVFLIVTRPVAATSAEKLPHGVFVAWWDDFENRQGGMQYSDRTTNEVLMPLGETELQYLNRERFLRYLLPPFLRHFCLTGSDTACKWADTDVRNFDDGEEWIEFLRRLRIGMISGLITGVITWIIQGALIRRLP
jgi:hypothetical protein